MAEGELPKPDELHEPAANSFSRRVALVTAIYAVVLAIAPPRLARTRARRWRRC
jgi:hypothetical protein